MLWDPWSPPTATLVLSPSEIFLDHLLYGTLQGRSLLVRSRQDTPPNFRMFDLEALGSVENLTLGRRACQGKEVALAFVVLVPALPGT